MAKVNRLFRSKQYERQDRDFYPTPAWATECLTDTVPLRGFIWEPCAGQGVMAKTIVDAGYPEGIRLFHSPSPVPIDLDRSPFGRTIAGGRRRLRLVRS